MCSSPAERAYEISHSGPASRPEERENSIFVAALKEHVQKGTLNTRIDRLLTEAAEGLLELTVLRVLHTFLSFLCRGAS